MNVKTFFIVLFISIVALVISYPIWGVINTGGSAYGKSYFYTGNFNKTLNNLNSALSYAQQQGETINYNDMQDFADTLNKFLPVQETKYMRTSNPYTKLKENEIYKYKLQEYKQKPIINTYDDVSIMFYKFENDCKIVDTVNVEKSDCIIDADLNTYKNPKNNKKYNDKNPKNTDRYSYIIDGNNNKVVLPNMYDLIKHI